MFNQRVMFIVFTLLLTACKTNGGKNENTGTILGGVLGAVVGSQVGRGDGRVVAGAAGAILGAYLGGQIGRELDEADRIKMAQTTQRALEKGKNNTVVPWVNPNTQHSGTVTPKAFYFPKGQTCREFTQTVTIGGKTKEAYGKACRQSDGSWKIVP